MTVRPGTTYSLPSIVLGAIFIVLGAILTPDMKRSTPHRKQDTRKPTPYGATSLIRKRPPPYDHQVIALLEGPRGARFLMSEVPL